MTIKANKPAKKLLLKDPSQQLGNLKKLGGSASDDWNQVLANQTVQTLWAKSDEAELDEQLAAMTAALVGIAPKDELEGMMAAQLLAAHNAAMECYRRAMIPTQSTEGRRENLNQANKLSRTYTTLIEALNRHRGKGQQKVTVEHVHVHSGGQAVVGVVCTQGGEAPKSKDQSHAKQITHAPQPTMRGKDKERDAVPIPSDAERPLPHARRSITGSTKG